MATPLPPADSLVLARLTLPDGRIVIGDCIVRADGSAFVNPELIGKCDRGAPYRFDVEPPHVVIVTHPSHFVLAAEMRALFGAAIVAPELVRPDPAPPDVTWMEIGARPVAGAVFGVLTTKVRKHAMLAVATPRGPHRGRVLTSPASNGEYSREPRQPFTLAGTRTHVLWVQTKFAIAWRLAHVRAYFTNLWWRTIPFLLSRVGIGFHPTPPIRADLRPAIIRDSGVRPVG